MNEIPKKIAETLCIDLGSAFYSAAEALRALDAVPEGDVEPIPAPEVVAYNPRPWQFTLAAFQNAPAPAGMSQAWRHLGVYAGAARGSATTSAALERAQYTGHTGRMIFLAGGPENWHKYFTEKRLGREYWSKPMPYLAITARICDASIPGKAFWSHGTRQPEKSSYVIEDVYEQRMTKYTDVAVKNNVIRTLDIVRDNLVDQMTTVVWVLSQESEAFWFADSPMTIAEGELFTKRWNIVNVAIQQYAQRHGLPWYTSMSTNGSSQPRDDIHRGTRDLVFGVNGFIGQQSRPDIVSNTAYDLSSKTTSPANWFDWDNPLSGISDSLERAVEWDCLYGVNEFMIGRDINQGGQHANRDNPAFLELMAALANSCTGIIASGVQQLSTITRQWPQLAEFCMFWSDTKGYTLTEDETPLSLARAQAIWGD